MRGVAKRVKNEKKVIMWGRAGWNDLKNLRVELNLPHTRPIAIPTSTSCALLLFGNIFKIQFLNYFLNITIKEKVCVPIILFKFYL